MAVSAIGTGISAAGTIAGGNASRSAGTAAQVAGQMQQQALNAKADQQTSNAAGELAAAQRTMLDTRLKTSLTQSTMTAKAAGSGFNAATGSMLNNSGEIAQRGEYQALMDVFGGQNEMTGTLNQADATRYSGKIAALEGDAKAAEGEARGDAADLSALGTIAGGAGSMLKTYGSYAYPSAAKSFG